MKVKKAKSGKKIVKVSIVLAVLAVMLAAVALPIAPAFAATTYTVTFVANGGTRTGGGDLTQSVNSGQIYASLTTPTLTKTGYEFDGWWLDAACTTTPLGSMQGNGITSNVSIYAKWIVSSGTETVQITFSANGGTLSGNSSIVVEKGIAWIDVTRPSVSREGYTMRGWSTDPNYNYWVSGNINSNIVVYARWDVESDPEQHTVNFVLNGGTRAGGGAISQTVNHGQIYASLSVPTVSKTGYTFAGWWLDAACTTTPLGSLQSNGITSNVSIYAKWVSNTIIITYNVNGGTITAGSDTETVTYGTVYDALTPPTVSREGYTFSGWYTADDIAIGFMPQEVIPSSMTLTAHWSSGTEPDPDPEQHTVTFVLNEGEQNGGGALIQTVNHGQIYASLSVPTVSKIDFIFAGWWLDPACTTTPLGSMQSNGINSDVSIYAKWVPGTLTITYDANGGTITAGSDTETVAYGTVYDALTPPAVSREGYTFMGWYTADDIAIGFMPQEVIPSDITLTARWAEIKELVITNNINDETKVIVGKWDNDKKVYVFYLEFSNVYNIKTDAISYLFNPVLKEIATGMKSNLNVSKMVFSEMYAYTTAPFDGNEFFQTTQRLDEFTYDLNAEWQYKENFATVDVFGIKFFATEQEIADGKAVVNFVYVDEPLPDPKTVWERIQDSEILTWIFWIIVIIVGIILLPYIIKLIAWIFRAIGNAFKGLRRK